MKCLIVEDDFVARRFMLKWLSDIGDCDIAVNGFEAADAFRHALREGDHYDLVCLDIMMPKMDGHQVLKTIRELEHKHGIDGLAGAKVIMTTALGGPKHVLGSFKEGCEAYMVKPIAKQKLLSEIEKLGLTGVEVGCREL